MNNVFDAQVKLEIPEPLAVKVATDLSRSTVERLDSAAREHGITRAEFLRALIAAYFKES